VPHPPANFSRNSALLIPLVEVTIPSSGRMSAAAPARAN